jgi:hypothetical protein
MSDRSVVRLAAPVLNQIPTTLLLLAEGLWIAIPYQLLQVASSEPTTLGPLAFAVGAGAGTWSAMSGPRFLGSRWPLTATLLFGLAGAAGWMLSTHTRAVLLSADPAAAFATHPGGWLMSLAFLRGVSVGGAGRETAPTGSLVIVGVPAIALTYALAAAMERAKLDAFAAAADPDTLLFVACGLVGLALVRIRWLGAISPVRWSTNRAWLGLLLALVAGMLLLAVPASSTVPPLVMLIVALLPLPILAAGLVVGLDRRLFRVVLSMVIFAVVGVAVVQAIMGRPVVVDQGGAASGGLATNTPDHTWLVVGGWLLLLAAVAIAVAIMVLLWMRKAPARLEDAGEERTIDRGPEREHQASPVPSRQPRWGGAPRDAAEAYLAALDLLAAHDDLRRLAGETPAEHVRRLSSPEPPAASPTIARPLALLAADFELFRFAGRALTPAEHRRGLARWGSIRAAVRKRPRQGRLF